MTWIQGTDISHWQDDSDTPKEIDFIKMRDAGARFVIPKATHGVSMDHLFVNSWNDAQGILPRGAYHWLSWNKPGLEQAKYYCDVISRYPIEIAPAVDFEDRIGIPQNAHAHLWNWLDYVEDQTGKVPIIYTAPYFWMEFGGTDIAWAKYPLWIANYYAAEPMIPTPWKTWLLWQYTPKGDGFKYGVESHQIDLDWFNGSEENFAVFTGNTVIPEEPTHDEKVSILWGKAKVHGWI